MKKLYKTQLTLLALALSSASFSVMAEDGTVMTDWQTPLAAEFSRLDTTGNGLLKPNEASRGNAFNKRTFAQADVDHDGYIDQNEYIHFKTGEWPVVVQPNQALVTPDPLNQNTSNPDTSNSGTSNQELLNMDQTDANHSSLESNKHLSMTKELSSIDVAIQQAKILAEQNATTVVSDDVVITHKAIVSLLSTDELAGMKISVETYLGEVLLSGVVDSQKDKMKAAYVVSKVDGVKSVKNELIVMS
jgi:hyperosmotically inducible protein